MTHNIKILESFADAVASGEKTFEVRENDRGYQKGDKIKFEVVDKHGFYIYGHNLTNQQYEITYVLSGWGIKEGWVVFGIREISGRGEA